MDPIAFHVGSWPVYWYGIFAAAGFVAAILHWGWLGPRVGRVPGTGSDLALWIMLGGIIGARAAFVIANWEQFQGNPGSVFALHEGGLIYYGGALGGLLATLAYARVHKEPLWPLGDFVVSALPLAHALGRIGCFTRGCCYGALCPPHGWFVEMNGETRYPVQLYESAANIGLYLFLLVTIFKTRNRPGLTVAAYCVGYGAIRFCTEFFRGDERMNWEGLNVAQWISTALIMAGFAIAAKSGWAARLSSAPKP